MTGHRNARQLCPVNEGAPAVRGLAPVQDRIVEDRQTYALDVVPDALMKGVEHRGGHTTRGGRDTEPLRDLVEPVLVLVVEQLCVAEIVRADVDDGGRELH